VLGLVDGSFLARRRRRKMIRIARRVRNMRPPTTPPTIAPIGALCLGWGVGVGVGLVMGVVVAFARV
jgi:hypothetical protein